ncbi:MAG: hypothetical protein WCD69_06215 [Xanthobacteraceae bacterium]
MPDNIDQDIRWLSVIGRSLAYLCLDRAQQTNSFASVLDKVDFLAGLGLTASEAAYAAGSTPESVRVMRAQKKGGKRVRKK